MLYVRYSLILFLSLLSSAAFAKCDLKDFNKSDPPSPITDVVDNQYGYFRWASDGDVIEGQAWIWNYIENQHDKASLAATWQKAGIKIKLANPLPPKTPFCNKFYVEGISDQIDYDAPIVYGTNNQVQRAAVQSEAKTSKQGRISSEIETAYQTSDNQSQELYVYINFNVEGGTLKNFQIVAPDEIYTGLSGIAKLALVILNNTTPDLQGAQVTVDDYSKFATDNTYQEISDIFPTVVKEPLLFIKGTLKDIPLDVPVSGQKTVNVVILDKNRNLLATALATVPVPSE